MIAGHGVDFKRMPGEQFRLLCLVAVASPKGITQPELVAETYQASTTLTHTHSTNSLNPLCGS